MPGTRPRFEVEDECQVDEPSQPGGRALRWERQEAEDELGRGEEESHELADWVWWEDGRC